MHRHIHPYIHTYMTCKHHTWIHGHIHYNLHGSCRKITQKLGWIFINSQHATSKRVTWDHHRQPDTLHKETKRDLEGDFNAAASVQGDEMDKGANQGPPLATPLPPPNNDVEEPPLEPPVPPPELSFSAVDKRLRRLMIPTARGEYKIPEEVRAQWEDKTTRESVMSLFEKCAYSPDWFAKTMVYFQIMIVIKSCNHPLLPTRF